MEKGFSGTPSFHFVREATAEAFPLVGAQPYEQFAGLIDTLVAGGTPETAQEESGNNEIPFWATADGLKPDPDRPNQTMAGDFYRGNPDAKVVVIEFSDFQCPFCRKHTLETQPILDEQFVATDQIRWVFKHFPLTIHPQAPAAGAAAECAAEQGKFWEMHDKLFNTMQEWSVSDPTPVFADLAQQLELDVDAFTTCVTGEEAASRVQEDLEAGTPFVRGTPTFIVLYNGQGSIIPGALPAERFISILQEVLDSVVQ
jgi:protein-disulfide isomerase